MNLLFRFLLTMNASSWMLVVYWIKEGVTLWQIPQSIYKIINVRNISSSTLFLDESNFDEICSLQLA